MDIVTYALCKKFALKVAAGFSSVSVDEPTSTINFTLNDGTKVSLKIPQLRGIEDIYLETRQNPTTLEDEVHLMFKMTDGTKEDAGILPGGNTAISKVKDNRIVQKLDGIYVAREVMKLTQEEYDNLPESEKKRTDIVYFVDDPNGEPGGGGGALSEELVATVNIGSVTNGKKYPAGTSLETIIRDILISYLKPVITIGINPVKNIYDIVEDSLNQIEISANVTKKSEDIEYIRFFVDDNLVGSITSSVESGGLFKYNHVFTPAVNKTFTVKVETRDVKTHSVVSAQTTVTFIGKSYYGTIEDGTPIDETSIKALGKELKNKLGATYSYTASYGRFVYAYPAELGTVTSVKDLVNNFTYTASCDYDTITIDGLNYKLVYLKDPMGFADVQITYA